MNSIENLMWKLRTNDAKERDFPYGNSVCSGKDVLLRGVQRLALFWLLGLLSVFIPVAHFVLVPALLLVGIVVFALQLKFTHFVERGTLTCPNCEQEIKLVKFYFRNGQRLYCDHCNSQLVILGS